MSENARNSHRDEAETPPASGGAASGLQPGGTAPGGQPGATRGSIGTGGGSTGQASGNLEKRRRQTSPGHAEIEGEEP